MLKVIKKIIRYINLIIKRYNKREKETILYKEKYKTSIFVVFITAFLILIVLATSLILFTESSGTYLYRWFAFTSGAILILLGLSAPSSIVITNKNINLNSLVDLTQIPICSIEHISVIHKKEYKYYFPLLVSFGYLGYYGYFFNFKYRELCKIYVSRYDNWIVIKTNQGTKYITNVRNPNEFISYFEKLKITLK